jgi:iron complex transport system substrate-binding protein
MTTASIAWRCARWAIGGWLLAQPLVGSSGSPAPPTAAAGFVTLRDDWGRELRVAHRPRIVSLAPHATELLFAAGAGGQLVAVDVDSDHPPEVTRLPKVPSWPAIDAEALHALAPGLIVAWGAGLDARQLQRLDAIAPTFVSEPSTLEAIGGTLERMAAVSADPARARATAGDYAAALAALRERHRDRPPVTVFYQVWDRPLMTVSDRGTIGEAMRICGARNPFGALPQAAPVVDVEAVLAASPQLVVVSDGAARARERWRRLGLWQGRPERLARIDASLLQRPTPRMLDAVEALCGAVETARR